VRDIGAILWVVIVIVGVVSSIVSNARKQMARPTPQQRQQPVLRLQPQSAPQAATARPAAQPRPTLARRPPAQPAALGADIFPAHERPQPRPRQLASLFGDRRSLVRAVIAAEVLGKPLAMRDGY